MSVSWGNSHLDTLAERILLLFSNRSAMKIDCDIISKGRSLRAKLSKLCIIKIKCIMS